MRTERGTVIALLHVGTLEIVKAANVEECKGPGD